MKWKWWVVLVTGTFRSNRIGICPLEAEKDSKNETAEYGIILWPELCPNTVYTCWNPRHSKQSKALMEKTSNTLKWNYSEKITCNFIHSVERILEKKSNAKNRRSKAFVLLKICEKYSPFSILWFHIFPGKFHSHVWIYHSEYSDIHISPCYFAWYFYSVQCSLYPRCHYDVILVTKYSIDKYIVGFASWNYRGY